MTSCSCLGCWLFLALGALPALKSLNLELEDHRSERSPLRKPCHAEVPLLSSVLLLQALGNEAMQLLGVLADVNPRVLTAIEGMALELGGDRGKECGPWVSVLVSQIDFPLLSGSRINAAGWLAKMLPGHLTFSSCCTSGNSAAKAAGPFGSPAGML